MSYSEFADVYDILMKDAKYKKRTAYLWKLFKTHGKTPKLLLDLACGTGEFSVAFAMKGVEVIGVDMSEDMLAVAREKTADNGLDILYLCQKAEELDLYGTVDGAICCLDSLNHITDINKLSKAVKRVSLFMEEGSLFIFDLNTEYKHRNILGNNTFVMDEEEVYCVWQNRFDEKRLITDINLDFFLEDGDTYIRSSESFKERAYTKEQIEGILNKAGLEIQAVYGDLSFESPKEDSQRIIYVTKKV
ncbi:MAG: class I SAM-dependent methyltransferase [Clostridia bacterium]|nr:class I SAM-dependent methyltransferase [Clostridia bacterium]